MRYLVVAIMVLVGCAASDKEPSGDAAAFEARPEVGLDTPGDLTPGPGLCPGMPACPAWARAHGTFSGPYWSKCAPDGPSRVQCLRCGDGQGPASTTKYAAGCWIWAENARDKIECVENASLECL